MKRLIFQFSGILFAALLLSACSSQQDAVNPGESACPENVFPLDEPDYDTKRTRDFSPYEAALAGFSSMRAQELDGLLSSKTIPEIQTLLAGGNLTSEELVIYYLERIQRYDVDKLNSVMELNPEVLEAARQLDQERTAGSLRGPLHGIPVLIKDNIAVDGLHAAAGAYALKDWQPDRDAFLVGQLRQAGALILGKANLSEWANYMDRCMPNGFSALGGQTRHSYGPFDPLGSSSGSAVSVAANLVTASVGSETQGSIIKPAEVNGVVGFKTSRGPVSRDYIIPLVDWHDVPGPIGRSVTDVAVLLSAMTGVDPKDPDAQAASALAGLDFTQFLSLEAAQKVRVGVAGLSEEEFQKIIQPVLAQAAEAKGSELTDEEIEKITREYSLIIKRAQPIVDTLESQGIQVVVIDPAEVASFSTDIYSVLEYGFQDSFNRFMNDLGDQAPLDSLADVVRINAEDLPNRAPYGQGYVSGSVNSGITAEQYATMVNEQREGAAEFLRGLFEKYNVDLLVTSSQEYAAAGFPALTVPTGVYPQSDAGLFAAGMPYGITLVGDYLSEPQLLAVGYSYEQAIHGRVEPDLDATIAFIEALSK